MRHICELWCNMWLVVLNLYDLGLYVGCLRSFAISLDYRVYMGSSTTVWSLRWLLLYLCSYKLDGSVTMMLFINLHTPLQKFMARESMTKEISSALCLLSLLPRSRATAGLLACSCCFIAPVPMSINHNVCHILPHASVKCLCYKSLDAGEIIVSPFPALLPWLLHSYAWHWRSPLIHCPNHQTLHPTYPSYTCTYLNKLTWP